MLNFKLVVYFCGSRMFKPLKFYCRKILLSAFVQFGKMSLIFTLILPPVKPVLESHLRGGQMLAPFRSGDPLVQTYLYYKLI